MDQRDYQCSKCLYTLRYVALQQTSCGHLLCAGCAGQLFGEKDSTPVCPRSDCRQKLTTCTIDGHSYYPGQFLCKEKDTVHVQCKNVELGCNWMGPIPQYDSQHLKECGFTRTECPYCKGTFTLIEYSAHSSSCSLAPVYCPLKDYGCNMKEKMTREECTEHITSSRESLFQHIMFFATFLSSIHDTHHNDDDGENDDDPTVVQNSQDREEEEEAQIVILQPEARPCSNTHISQIPSASLLESSLTLLNRAFSLLTPKYTNFGSASCRGPITTTVTSPPSIEIGQVLRLVHQPILPPEIVQLRQSISTAMTKITELQNLLAQKDNTILMLHDKIKALEVNQLSKSSENEDRDFRLSLMESNNFDGTMVWKIPQFSQRMDDARTGKYTSIFSLPFYTSRHGYKVCLRLYILGDGIGKGSHMSLFFVVMKGEFDNILQWPFTHKVTFKLINQCGGRDIIDSFKPDPLSSSFQQPKSDMNVASGCPKFVSLTELMNGGYIVDDTVFIKVKVDTSTMPPPQQ